MSDVWKQWEGQVVDGRFTLRQFLGASDRGPVFLTDSGGADWQQCAVKLQIADPETADAQIARWEQAAKLTHAHLLRVLEAGRCRLGDARMIYALLEYADEDLGQVVPVRSLTETETREMLRPTLEALAFLHGKGLVHGHVKPSNVMAVGDRLKISCDGISAARNPTFARGKATAYDAPEAGTRGVSAAGDVWSLGVTLVEVLTQKLPVWEWKGQEEPQLPRMPAPFGEIAKQCLRRDPQQRCTLTDIASRLDPEAPVLGKQSATKVAAPVLVPESATASTASAPATATPKPTAQAAPVAAAPAKKPTAPVTAAPGKTGATARARVGNGPRKQNIALPAIAIAAAALLAVILVPKLLHRNAEMSPDLTASAANQPAAAATSAAPDAVTPATSAPAADSGSASNSSSPAPADSPAADNSSPATPTAPATPAPSAPAAAPTPAPEPPPAPKSLATGGAGGSVAHEVLPNVPQKALDTIQGKVRTGVRVEVDASGKVTDAEIDSAGPSKYFANLSEKAARDWEFVPPTSGGQPAPSEWVVRFEFSPDGAKATAAPASR